MKKYPKYKINKKECAICGLKEVAYLQVHHIDRNHSNNDIKNLQVLCILCHRKEHANDSKNKRNVICHPSVESIYICSKCKMPILDENTNFVSSKNTLKEIKHLIIIHKCYFLNQKQKRAGKKYNSKIDYEQRYLEIRDYIRSS